MVIVPSGHETSEWNSGPVKVTGKIAIDFSEARLHPVQVGGKQKSVHQASSTGSRSSFIVRVTKMYC